MLSERLKTLRSEAKLTQKEIAEKLEISQQFYAKWESNKSKPASKNLNKLADFFNVSVDYLLGNTNERNSQFELDLDDALDKSVAYDGNELSDSDRETIKEYLRDFFANKGK